MLYGLKCVKKFIGASKDFLFEEKLTLKAMIIPDSKREGFVVVPQQHHGVGGKNSSVNTPFCDSFVCNKSTLQACYILVYCHRNMIDTCIHLQRANRMFLR